jgi:hypothetical protein
MASQQWYVVAKNNDILGPLSTRDLRAMVAARELLPDDRVSPDREKWYHATALKGLFTSSPTDAGVATTPAAPVTKAATGSPAAAATAPLLAPVAAAVPIIAAPILAELVQPLPQPPSPPLMQPGEATRSASLPPQPRQRHKEFIAGVITSLWATCQWLVSVAHYAKIRFDAYGLRRAVDAALLVLGNKMYQAGLGDRQLIDQVAELTKQIEVPGTNPAALRQLKESRRRLTVRLAGTTTAAACPAGVVAEYRAARAAIYAVHRNDELLCEQEDIRRGGAGGERRRLIVGACSVGALVCVCGLAVVLVVHAQQVGTPAVSSSLPANDAQSTQGNIAAAPAKRDETHETKPVAVMPSTDGPAGSISPPPNSRPLQPRKNPSSESETGEIDPAVVPLLGDVQFAYAEYGYQNVNLGASFDEINARTPLTRCSSSEPYVYVVTDPSRTEEGFVFDADKRLIIYINPSYSPTAF